MSETNVVYDDPKQRIVKCQLGSCLETDWCQADAMRESLREHMKLLKAAQERIAHLESQRIDEVVVGDRLTHAGYTQGTVLSTSLWDDKIKEAGLTGKWCQIIIRPVGT